MSSKKPYRRVVLTVSVPAKKMFNVVSTRFFRLNSALEFFPSCRERGCRAESPLLRTVRAL